MMRKVLFFTVGAVMFSLVAQAAPDGAALFKQKMCGACHLTGKTAPDLTKSKLDKKAIMEFLKNPKARNPEIKMPAFKGSDEELGAIADYILGMRKK